MPVVGYDQIPELTSIAKLDDSSYHEILDGRILGLEIIIFICHLVK